MLDAEGRAQQAAESFNQALTSYGKLAALQPNSIQPHLRMAEVHLAAKNKDAAMQSLKKALSIKPDSIEAQRGIMMLDLQAGRTEEALSTARKLQKQWPKEAVGYVLEGDLRLRQKEFAPAVTAYQAAYAKTPNSQTAQTNVSASRPTCAARVLASRRSTTAFCCALV